MPRHVDAEERRRHVAEALWRVVVRDGLDRATVRAVAAEARLSLGAVSHYFASQEALQLHALQLIDERDAARHLEISDAGTTRDVIERYLWALLPLDQESRESHQIYYAFMARARVVPAFREVAAAIDGEVVSLCRRAIDSLDRDGCIAPGHDRGVLVAELRALTEGLAFQAASWPEQATPEMMQAVMRRWLDSLAVPTPPA